MTTLELYALFDTNDCPHRLKSSGSDEFYFYFPPPLPSLIVLFMVSKDTDEINYVFKASVYIDNELPEDKYIGEMGGDRQSICWNGTWTNEEVNHAKKVQKLGRVLKLSVFKEDVPEEIVEETVKKVKVKKQRTILNEDELIKSSLQLMEDEFGDNQKSIKKLHASLNEKDKKSNVHQFFKKKRKDSVDSKKSANEDTNGIINKKTTVKNKTNNSKITDSSSETISNIDKSAKKSATVKRTDSTSSKAEEILGENGHCVFSADCPHESYGLDDNHCGLCNREHKGNNEKKDWLQCSDCYQWFHEACFNKDATKKLNAEKSTQMKKPKIDFTVETTTTTTTTTTATTTAPVVKKTKAESGEKSTPVKKVKVDVAAKLTPVQKVKDEGVEKPASVKKPKVETIEKLTLIVKDSKVCVKPVVITPTKTKYLTPIKLIPPIIEEKSDDVEEASDTFDFNVDNLDVVKQGTLFSATKIGGKRNSPFASKPKLPKKACTSSSPPCFSELLPTRNPSSRWGHSFCTLVAGSALVVGGEGAVRKTNADSIWWLDTITSTWRSEQTNDMSVSRRVGHTACYDEKDAVVYLYGGTKHDHWYHDVHQLDIKSWKWTKLETIGKAPTRAYHTCTQDFDELLIFGGTYPTPAPEPDGCSNELHIFNKEDKSWYSPTISGDIPPGRSGHSACLLGMKLYIFGGWDSPTCFNDLHVLDLGIMTFVKQKMIGSIPSPRTWHASQLLTDQKRFCIYGGFDGERALDDLYIFQPLDNSWTKLFYPGLIRRAGHGIIPRTGESGTGEKLFVFGGGDNEGYFYNDLATIAI